MQRMSSFIIDLNITGGQSTWIMTAFQLTSASFLLVVRFVPLEPIGVLAESGSLAQSGRIRDVYNPIEWDQCSFDNINSHGPQNLLSSQTSALWG